MSIEFLVTSLIVVATPGTGVLYTMAAGFSRGARASVIAAGTEEPNAFLRMVGLSAVFMLLTLVVFVGYGYFAAAIRNHVISRPRVVAWMRRVFAGTFAALGARLAFADR